MSNAKLAAELEALAGKAKAKLVHGFSWRFRTFQDQECKVLADGIGEAATFKNEDDARLYGALVNNLPAILSALRAEPDDAAVERIGPRPHVLVCKGCPAYETKAWSEVVEDEYDSGQYAWCNAAGRRSMGAYHYDHDAAPEWCPARAAIIAMKEPRDG